MYASLVSVKSEPQIYMSCACAYISYICMHVLTVSSPNDSETTHSLQCAACLIENTAQHFKIPALLTTFCSISFEMVTKCTISSFIWNVIQLKIVSTRQQSTIIAAYLQFTSILHSMMEWFWCEKIDWKRHTNSIVSLEFVFKHSKI